VAEAFTLPSGHSWPQWGVVGKSRTDAGHEARIHRLSLAQVPVETLSRWSAEHTTVNEVGNFLLEVSTEEVGSSISKELRRLNKRWRKFITKTPLVSFLLVLVTAFRLQVLLG
jgi:hypothetical protein